MQKRAVAGGTELSQAEMVEIVTRILNGEGDYEFYRKLFRANCRHPNGLGLIFAPFYVPEYPCWEHQPTAEEVADLALRGES